MSAIVCLSPEGNLEIWNHVIDLQTGKHLWEIEFYSPYDKGYSYIAYCGFIGSPGFWGREYLGEL